MFSFPHCNRTLDLEAYFCTVNMKTWVYTLHTLSSEIFLDICFFLAEKTQHKHNPKLQGKSFDWRVG
jgi:hypothetical protein